MSILIDIILFVLLIVILIIFVKYNKLVKRCNSVKNAKANIEIYLNKRFDLIPNVVECVKSYSGHEKGTLEEITSLRSSYNSSKSFNINDASKLNNKLTNILATVEAYPDLKADSQYLNLQGELRNIENELEEARKVYNNEVRLYNTSIESVPTNIIASIFDFRKAAYFKVESDKKENIKVNL